VCGPGNFPYACVWYAFQATTKDRVCFALQLSYHLDQGGLQFTPKCKNWLWGGAGLRLLVEPEPRATSHSSAEMLPSRYHKLSTPYELLMPYAWMPPSHAGRWTALRGWGIIERFAAVQSVHFLSFVDSHMACMRSPLNIHEGGSNFLLELVRTREDRNWLLNPPKAALNKLSCYSQDPHLTKLDFIAIYQRKYGLNIHEWYD